MYCSQAPLFPINSQSLLKFMSIESVMLSNRLILCHSSFCLQSFPASGSFPMIQFFGPKYWSFSFSISPSSEDSGLISFSMDWFGLLAVQGILKSLLHSPAPQFKSSSLELSLLCGPTLTSVHDYWPNHSFLLYRPLLAKWYFCFLICCLGLS